MVTILFSFIIVGISFFLLSLFHIKIWLYLVPVSLIFALLWLRIYNSRYKSLAQNLLKKYPDLIEDETSREMFLASPSLFLSSFEFITTFVKMDFTSTTAYSFIISVIYIIISLIRSDWVSVFLCAIIIYDSLYGNIRDAFESPDRDHNIFRVTHRYLKSKNKSIKKASTIELNELAERYEDIINRLNTYKM